MLNHNVYLWDLPLVIIVVSLVYSATRFDQWGNIFRESVRWMVRLTAFLGIIGLVLFAVSYLGHKL
jgi:hypothetical protein